MTNKTTSIKRFFASLLTIGILSTVTISASAAPPAATGSGSRIYLDTERNWYYGCYPERDTAINAFPPPNILIMLDTSASMRYEDRRDGIRSKRIERAKDALFRLLKANGLTRQPMAYFGFGNYPYYSGRWWVSDARINNECAPGNDTDIWGFAQNLNPNGGTPTHAAVELAAQSSCNRDLRPNQSSATAIITDGEPSGKYAAAEKTCQHRKIAPLFTIGLGGGTNKLFNDVMAAAGGTGKCTTADGRNWDPCDHLIELSDNYFWTPKLGVTCEGSLSANDTDDLIHALKNIVAKVSCNFPLDTVGLDSSRIPNDPENKYPWIKIELQQPGGSGTRSVTNENDTSSDQARQNKADGWTWKFANSEKNMVTLGAGACSAIKQQQVTSVKTQVGCICLQPPGTECGGQMRQGQQICPPGTFTCDRGQDRCEGTEQSNKTTVPCKTTQVGICKYGHYECVAGSPACVANNRPMPELCDGVDNDCDGDEDNIDTSWKKPAFVTELEKLEALQTPAQREELGPPSTYKDYRLRACEGKNLCICPTLEAKPVPIPMSSADLNQQYSSYTTYWEDQRGDCHCQAI